MKQKIFVFRTSTRELNIYALHKKITHLLDFIRLGKYDVLPLESYSVTV